MESNISFFAGATTFSSGGWPFWRNVQICDIRMQANYCEKLTFARSALSQSQYSSDIILYLVYVVVYGLVYPCRRVPVH